MFTCCHNTIYLQMYLKLSIIVTFKLESVHIYILRPIVTYNSEIWFMDDYFSISRAISRSEQSGSVCDTLSLEDKFCYEKIHNKL